MQILIFCLAATIVVSTSLQTKDPCDEVFCKAGRECVVLEGKGECLCQISCPDHLKPVCGSDGESYDNHCLLHQEACMTDVHIRVDHKGYCKEFYGKGKKLIKKDKNTKLENALENELIGDIKNRDNKRKELKQTPAVCYSPQRNALRFLIVANWEESLKNQTWHVEGMTFRESLWGWFYTCDSNKNNYLTPEELLSCSKKVSFFARPGQDIDLTKALCIDAMVSDGDTNSDFRLDFSEFTKIMNPDYMPTMKKCSLEGNDFVDGEEVQVDCNHCICAVGKWVCASKDCSTKSKNNNKYNHIEPVLKSDGAKDIKIFNHNSLFGEDNLAKKFFEGKPVLKVNNLMDPNYEELLFEKTKNKNSEKKKYKFENALKEIKQLKKKTKKLKKYWKGKVSESEDNLKPYIPKKQKDYKKLNKAYKNKKIYKSQNHFYTENKY